MQERTQDTYLVYNDTVVLHRNEYERDTDEMILLLKQIKDDTYSGKVRFQGEDTCLLSTVRVKPDYSDDYYTLVSVCPYEEIAGSGSPQCVGKSCATACLCGVWSWNYSGIFQSVQYEGKYIPYCADRVRLQLEILISRRISAGRMRSRISTGI